MSLRPITNEEQAVCPNVHVYFITKTNCPACVKFKKSGEMDKIIKYLVGKTTTSTHDISAIRNESWVPQEIKDNLMWAPMVIVQIGTDEGNQYGVFNGTISDEGLLTRHNKYKWNQFEAVVQWLCDTIPKRYCNDNNICIDETAYTTNPFYA